jgi:RNase H-fold protein (predicted Holliday junction resolvase)
VRKQIGVPVELVDERLTSWEAGQLLRKKGKRFKGRDAEKRQRSKNRGSSVDAMAAVLILREYLEQRQIPREHS